MELPINSVNPFDGSVLHFLNGFAQRYEFFDRFVVSIALDELVQGGLIVALFWWAWSRSTEPEARKREREFVLSGLALSIVALVIARALALELPFRVRPRYAPNLGFRLPIGSSAIHMIRWSSFPSDHAVLFFSLATCLFFISRKVGIALYCYVLLIVCLPRVYLGIHFPTDIAAGAALGIGVASLALIKPLREFIVRTPLRWHEKSPGLFYASSYVGTFMFATQFDSVRMAVTAVWKAVKGLS
jgi:undecaprenyl-diphosphatase